MSATPGEPAPPVNLVLSSGRCGSTLLSNILRTHPQVLSISELFSGLRHHDLTEREMSGAEFWEMLSTPSAADVTILSFRIKLDEVLYPLFDPRPGADRFAWKAHLPPILHICLPHLADRPDDLYASLEAATPGQPRRLLSEHLRWLFGELARGRRPAMVVERSGGSLAYAPSLLRLFPQARIVHLYRDGRECAVSMSRHASYRLAMIRAALTARLGYDPYLDASGRDCAAVADGIRDDDLARLTPDRIDPDSFGRFEVPLRRYGAMWTKMIADAQPVLTGAPHVLAMDYARLVDNPAENIGRLLDFLGLERDAGIEKRMAAAVRPGRDVRLAVGERQWDELTRACRLGMNFLYGRDGWK